MAVINKCDLIPYVDFDMDKAKQSVKKENPKACIFEVSAKTGKGFDEFCTFLEKELNARKKKAKS